MIKDDCNAKYLKCVPNDVLQIIIEEKAQRMVKLSRTNVSFEETLYSMVREWKKIKTK